MHSHEVTIPRRSLFEYCVRKVQVQEGLVVVDFEIYCHLNGVNKCIRRSVRHSPRGSIANHVTHMWEEIFSGAELTSLLEDDGREFYMFTPSEYSKISRRFKSWEFSGYFSGSVIRGQLQDQQVVDVEAAVLYGDIPLSLLPQFIPVSLFGGVIPTDCLGPVPSCKIQSVDSSKVRGVVHLGVSNVRDNNIASVSAKKLVGCIGDLLTDVSNFGGQVSVDQIPDGVFRLNKVNAARTHGRLRDIGVCDKAIGSYHIHNVNADSLTGFIPPDCLHKLTDRCIESVHGSTISGNLVCASAASQTLEAVRSGCRGLATETLEVDNGLIDRDIKSEILHCGVLECHRLSTSLRLDVSRMWMASAKVGRLECQMLECQSVSSNAISIEDVGNIRTCLVGSATQVDAEARNAILNTATVERLAVHGEVCASDMNAGDMYVDGVHIKDSSYAHKISSPTMRAGSLASDALLADSIVIPSMHCGHVSCSTSCTESIHISRKAHVEVMECIHVSCDVVESSDVVCDCVTAVDLTGGTMLTTTCRIDSMRCDILTCDTTDVLGRLSCSSDSMDIWKDIVSLEKRLSVLEKAVI